MSCRCLRFVSTLSLLIALTGLGACRKALRAPLKVDDSIEGVRAKYESLHPEDPLLETIARSEIQRGMNPTQVYVAWGLPLHSAKTEDGREWIYEFSKDRDTQPKTIAHLFFKRDRLVHWKIDRGYVYFLDPQGGAAAAEEIKGLPAPDIAKQLDR